MKYLLLAAVCLLGPLKEGFAKDKVAVIVVADSIPADKKDVASIDGIIAALYDVISGPAGQKRNWDRMRTLFIPGARLIPTGMGPDQKARARVMTPDDY